MRRGFSAAFWAANRQVWRLLPDGVQASAPMRAYGASLHRLVQQRSHREMYLGTFFLRNRPALELMRRIADSRDPGATLRIAVLGCSVGVEVYSILWMLRSARPDLDIVTHGVDTSVEVMDVARAGVYSPAVCEMVGSPIFDRLTDDELEDMFDWDGDSARVKKRLRDGIEWHVDDACDPELAARLGPQDIVVASNFLCHMDSIDADRCLRNIAALVDHGGYIFVSGVDLDVRAGVASELEWVPVTDLIEEIHDGDRSLRADWPWDWWGLEPLDRRRLDWRTRYAAVFQLVPPVGAGARR